MAISNEPPASSANVEARSHLRITFTGDEGDLGMSRKPRLDGAALAIRQQGHDATTLQVAQKRTFGFRPNQAVQMGSPCP